MIFRTNSQGVSETILEKEYSDLIDLFRKIEKEKNFLPCPKLIYKEMDLSEKVIRDSYNEKMDRIIVNDKEKYNRLIELEDIFFPGIKGKLFL